MRFSTNNQKVTEIKSNFTQTVSFKDTIKTILKLSKKHQSALILFFMTFSTSANTQDSFF